MGGMAAPRSSPAAPSTSSSAPADAAPRPYRIGFVCLGNICRSPMAELAMRRLLDEAGLSGEVQVGSAGTGDYHIGEQADERAAATLRARGYRPERHRARQFSAEDFDRVDLVVALDRSNFQRLRELAPTPEAAGRLRLLRSFDLESSGGSSDAAFDVPDPYFGGPDGFETALDLVESACRGLLTRVQRDLQIS
jgi:protein-tyrosine phosphatase